MRELGICVAWQGLCGMSVVETDTLIQIHEDFSFFFEGIFATSSPSILMVKNSWLLSSNIPDRISGGGQ